MKTTLKFLAGFLVTLCIAGHAQVVPEATGPGTLKASEKLQYAVRYAETGEFSTSFPDWQTSTVSGSIGYESSNEHLPFTLDYAGGYTWTLTGPDYQSGQFHRLFLAQGIASRQWKLLLSDDVSYLPQSPTTGFSGIPGTGEPIGGTSPAPPSSSESILTLNTHALSNITAGELSYAPSAATTLSFGGGFGLLRFPNNDGLNTNSLSANALFMRQLNGRNALSGSYLFSQFSYPGYSDTFEMNAALFGAERKWTRNLTTTVAGGPQWITSSTTTVVPSSTNVAANAAVSYRLRFASASVGYSRGANGGAGYLIGGQVDSLTGGLSRDFGTNFTLGLSGGFRRTAGLNNNGTTNGTFGGAETTWHLGRSIIVFANYTGENQTTTSPLPSSALNQLLQVIGFGVGYSPREPRGKQ
jgi:hypothetical protein